MNKWLFHQNRFTRTSLSATVTRVSNSVEENMCVWCVFTSSRLPVPVDSVTQCPKQQVKNMSIAMHSACSKHWIKVSKGAKIRNRYNQVPKCAVLLLNQVEGRLKSLKIQHRIFSWLTTIHLSFSNEYSHAPKMLSHISNRPRVAYLVLVTLISHG